MQYIISKSNIHPIPLCENFNQYDKAHSFAKKKIERLAMDNRHHNLFIWEISDNSKLISVVYNIDNSTIKTMDY